MPNEFLDQWNYGPLVRVPRKSLDQIPIAESAKRFLAEVGLPRKFMNYDFGDLETGIFPLAVRRSTWVEETTTGIDGLYVLGLGGYLPPSDVCIDMDGVIYQVSIAIPESGRQFFGKTRGTRIGFYNTTVEQFALSVLHYTREEASDDTADRRGQASANRLRQAIRSVDPSVFDPRKDSVWREIIGNIRTQWSESPKRHFSPKQWNRKSPSWLSIPLVDSRAMQEAFVEGWRFTSLVKVPPTLLDDIPIPESTKRFLYEVGLPDMDLFNLSSSTIREGMTNLWEVRGRPSEYKKVMQDYYLLGKGDNAEGICISKDGKIVFAYEGDGFTYDSVNEDIDKFAICLLIFCENSIFSEEYIDEDDSIEMRERIRVQMRQIDPHALRKRTRAFWKSKLDDIA